MINEDDSSEQPSRPISIGDLTIGRGVIRAHGKRSDKKGSKAFGRLLSKDHECLDFSDDQMNLVKELQAKSNNKDGQRSKIITDDTGSDWEAATYIRRELRKNQPNHGLFLLYPIEKTDNVFSSLPVEIIPIGIGLVFPPSHESTPITYMANNVFHTLEQEDEQQ
jgi:hypothetical protein